MTPYVRKFDDLDDYGGDDRDHGGLLIGADHGRGRIRDLVKVGLVVSPRDPRGVDRTCVREGDQRKQGD